MQTGAITSYIDVAQLVLYAFWIFFAGLIYYLHAENKREGYPLETDVPGQPRVAGFPGVPSPKTFLLADGTTVTVPRPAELTAQRDEQLAGPPLDAPRAPGAETMRSGVGPGAYAQRRDVFDTTIDGTPRIVPLRADTKFSVSPKDVDPRGLPVVGSDGVTGGIVRELWVDRPEVMFRYLEVEVTGAGGRGTVLLPVNMARIGDRRVVVDSLLGSDFAGVPQTREADSVTLLEEERVMAYYGAGTLYATADRAEPLL
jgi:photosynthetic reaction center H subunit